MDAVLLFLPDDILRVGVKMRMETRSSSLLGESKEGRGKKKKVVLKFFISPPPVASAN